jgi:lipopolysaccharide export system protein LptA
VQPRSRISPARIATATLLSFVSGLLISFQALALPEDSQQPIHIHSDSAELDQNKNLAIYHGSVKMEQGTMTVTGDTMTVVLQDQLVVRIIAEGDRAHYQQQVKPDESMVLADAKKIVYFTQEQRVELTGNAYLTQDKNEFTGELIKYDVNEGKVDASANGQGKVQMVLQPAALKKQQQSEQQKQGETPAPSTPPSPQTVPEPKTP